MIARAWYVMCDRCGSPAEVSTESSTHARRISRRAGFDRQGPQRDVCPRCLVGDKIVDTSDQGEHDVADD